MTPNVKHPRNDLHKIPDITYPHKETPWEISYVVKKRLEDGGNHYQIALLSSSDPEADFVKKCFCKASLLGIAFQK